MIFSTRDEQQTDQIAKLLEFITQQQEQIVLLKEHIEALEAEIRQLKKLPPKPDIKPNIKPSDKDNSGDPDSDTTSEEDNDRKPKVKKPDERTRNPRKSPSKPPVEEIIELEVDNVPPGSTWNGYTPFDIQELTIKAASISYLLAQWITPDGKTITAKPPNSLHGHHYGATLQAYILHQYYGCSVTQPQLLESLWDIGISISDGELSHLIIKNHDSFHAEKDDILATGIRCSIYIQTDDTGARHKGQNGYCTIICNESFAWYASTNSKSRENFLSLLHRPYRTYTLTEDALAYLEEHKYPQKWLVKSHQTVSWCDLFEP